MRELFKIEESLAPWLEWKNENGVKTYHSKNMSKEEKPWSAWFWYDEDDCGIPDDPELLGYGATEKEAVQDLALQKQIVIN